MVSEKNNSYHWEAPDDMSTVAKVIISADIAKHGSYEDVQEAQLNICFHYADAAEDFKQYILKKYRKTMEEMPVVKSLSNGQTQVSFSTASSDACQDALKNLANDHDLPRAELVKAEKMLALGKGQSPELGR